MNVSQNRSCANEERCRRPATKGEPHRPAIVRKANSLICSYCAAFERRGFSNLSLDPEKLPARVETRGRKRLNDGIDSQTRLRIQKSIASQKYAAKKRLEKKLGSVESEDFKERWAELQQGFELRKAARWGKLIGIDGTKPRHPKRTSKILERGITQDGRFEWRLLLSAQKSKYEIFVYQIDLFDGARTYDPFVRAGLGESEARKIIQEIRENGFKREKFLVPLSSYSAKANEFLKSAYSSRFSLREIEKMQKNITLGFAIAIFRASEEISLGGKDKRFEHLERVYRTLGNIPLREWAVTPAHIEGWLWAIITSRAEASGRTTERGESIKVQYAKKLIGTLVAIFDRLSYFPIVFPWADTVKRMIQDKRLKLQRKAMSQGQLAPSEGFRCLTLKEFFLILELTPTIHHVSFLIIGLSTGLRPEDLKVIESRDWDRNSGALFFRDGRLNRKNRFESRRNLANPHTSAVVRLILSTPEFFDPNKRKEIVSWFEGDDPYSMKKMESIIKIARWNNTPVATLRDFRTTAATQLAFCGVPLLDITRRLGHVSSITTESYYVKAIPSDGASCSHISPAIERGMTYLGNPVVKLPGKTDSYADTNPWDTFLLVWFIEEVKNRKLKKLKFEGHPNAEIEGKLWPEWAKSVLFTQVDKAIRHADIVRNEWSEASKRQTTGFLDMPFKIGGDKNN